MTTLDEIFRQIELLQDTIEGLPQRLVLPPQAVRVVAGLSDIDHSLGLVTAGEFRVGNGSDPGFGFTGVRIGYPAFSYDSQDWHIAGVSNDVLQFGVRATDGVALTGGGTVILDSDGITIDVPTFAGLTQANMLKFRSSETGQVVGQLYSSWVNSTSAIRMDLASGQALGTTDHSSRIDIISQSYNDSSSLNLRVFDDADTLDYYSTSITLRAADSIVGSKIDYHSIAHNFSTENIEGAVSPNSWGWQLIAGAHTDLTVSEYIDFYLDIDRTVDFDAGARTNQRAVVVMNPTYSADGATTITNGATVYIANAPVAGTNVTITNNYALWVDAGHVRLDGGLNVGGALGAGTAEIHVSDVASVQNGTGWITVGHSTAEPGYQWYRGAGGSNEKYWRMYSTSAGLHLQTVNDAYTGATDVIKLTRSGQTPTSIQLGAPITVSTVIGAHVTHSANQTITNNTTTTLAFDTERWDTDTIHDTVTNNSRLTCKTAGKYLIIAQVAWDATLGGRRAIHIDLNGSGNYIAVAEENDVADGTGIGRMTATTVYELAVNDYVEVKVYQNSGGNVAVLKAANYSPEFSMTRLA